MGIVAFVIATAVLGLVTGALARLALPGPDPMTLLQTIGLGVAGSLIAGLIVYGVSGGSAGAGLTLSILGSTVLLYFIRRSRGGGLASPGRR